MEKKLVFKTNKIIYSEGENYFKKFEIKFEGVYTFF